MLPGCGIKVSVSLEMVICFALGFSVRGGVIDRDGGGVTVFELIDISVTVPAEEFAVEEGPTNFGTIFVVALFR